MNQIIKLNGFSKIKNNFFKNNKNAFIETSCHYIFGDPDFLKIKHSIPKEENKKL